MSELSYWFRMPAIVDLTIKVSLCLIIGMVVDRFLLRQSAALRHAVWLSTLLAASILPLATCLLPNYQLAVLPNDWYLPSDTVLPNDSPTETLRKSSQAGAQERTNSRSGANNSATEKAPVAARFTAKHNAHEQSASLVPKADSDVSGFGSDKFLQIIQVAKSIFLKPQLGFYLFLVWACGFVTISLPLIFGLIRNAKNRRASSSVQDEHLLAWVDQQCRRMQISRSVQIREIDAEVTPMTWGILRPIILLPTNSWRQWSNSQTQTVLLHELAHVKRLDVLTHLLARVVLCVYWYNPLTWYAHNRLKVEREYACDDCVLFSGTRPSDYAHQLLCLARQFRGGTTQFALPIAHRTGLEKRIRAVLDENRPRKPLSSRTIALSLTIAGVIAFVLAAPTFTAATISAAQQPENQGKQPPPQSDKKIESEINVDDVAANELVGTVVDDQGQPLADALIDAWSWYPGNETSSDQLGRFRMMFDDLDRVDSKVEIRIMKDGYSPYYNPLQALGTPSQTFVLGQKTYIEGIVRDSQGNPEANVEVRGEHGPHQADGVLIRTVVTNTKTDENGVYRLHLHPDNYRLLVRGKDGNIARLDNILVAAQESKQQDIQLSKGVQFKAKVLNSETGHPFPGLVLWNFMHPGLKGVSDRDGNLTIDGMFPGEFEFQVGEGEPQTLGPFTGYLPRNLGRWWSPEATLEHQRKMWIPSEF